MDIAALNMSVRFDQVQGATAALKEQTKAASASERAAQKWGLATKEAGRSSDDFSKRVQRTIRDLEFERQQLARTATEKARFTALRRAGVSAASAEGQAITASVRALQAQQAALNQTSLAGRAFASVWSQIRGVVLAVGVALSGREILRAADAYTTMTNSLRITGLEGRNLAEVQNRLFASANKNGVEIGALSTLYSRASIAAAELGTSQTDLLKFVDGVTAAMRVQGGSAASSSGALLQLSQALGSGIVRAEEFNSILEGAFPIAQAAARGIDGMGGSVAKLRSAIVDGQITSKAFFEGLLKGFTATEAQAAGMSLTMGGALTALNNSFIRLVGTIDSTFGVSSGIAAGIAALGRSLDWLATNLGNIAKAATVAGVALAMAFAPATLGAMAYGFGVLGAAGVAAMKAITAAAMANPFVALATAITAVVAAVWYFRDEIRAAIGVDVIGIVKMAANYVINSFQAAYEDIKFVWANFGDIIGAGVIGAVNIVADNVHKIVQSAANGIDWLIEKANKIPGVNISKIGEIAKQPTVANPYADRLSGSVAGRNARINSIMSRDTIGMVGAAFSPSAPGSAPGALPPAGGLDATGKKGGSDPYAKAIESAREYVLSKKAETEAVGQTVLAAAQLKHQQDLLNKATGEGKTLSDAQRAALQSLAGQMAEADNALAKAKFSDDARTKSEEFLAQQEMERQALFMSAQAADALRMSTEMLNAAKRQGIELSPAEVEAIKASADAMAASRAQTDQMKQVVNLGREVFKGFFSDMREGLMNGKSVWESFGNAAVNALNRIAEKLIEMAATQLFEAAFPSNAGGGGGGGLGGLIGSLFGSGGGGGAAAGIEASWSGLSAGWAFANGAAFRAGNVIPFASGGIVGSPTMFPMSRGRAGLMGEAGPEAIMPLRRGPGGRLGVEAANGNNQQPVVVHVYANEGFVRAEAEGAAVRVVNNATPGIVKASVKRAGEQVPAVMARNERERGGDYRV